MFYRTNTRLYTQECKVGCFSLRSKKKGGLTYLSLPIILILALYHRLYLVCHRCPTFVLFVLFIVKKHSQFFFHLFYARQRRFQVLRHSLAGSGGTNAQFMVWGEENEIGNKFEVLFLLNNGGNLLNMSYSMAVFASYLATFLLEIVDFALFFIPLLH